LEERDATELIRPAIPATISAWADFGAGEGVFTRALADLILPGSYILAVDRDERALKKLSRRHAVRTGEVTVETHVADFTNLRAIPSEHTPFDGILCANSLHFVSDLETLLRGMVDMISSTGRLVVIEYDNRPASRWVPFPVSLVKLRSAAAATTFTEPSVVGLRPSAYGGAMYCAVLGLRGEERN
jgi:ubiquinone/menaquinone biosynthesis C-methylase UbiE